MKRLIKMLLILCLIYFVIQMGFKYFGKGHVVSYEIKGNDYLVKVKEVATFHTENETDNYYFTFTINNKDFFVQTYQTFSKNDHVVKNVKYFKNNKYECFYPIFKNQEVVTDILCESNNVIYNYYELAGKSGELDYFAKSLKSDGYDFTHWVDDTGKTIGDSNDPIIIYPKNITKNHYVGIDNYTGIYLINNYMESKNLYDIKVFSNDVYERSIEGKAGRYYIVADYNGRHEFESFYLVDLVYNNKESIKYHSPISFDSYIQGSVGNAIYLFDKSNKKQYKIDVKEKNIVEIGNEQTGIKYYNLGKWEEKKAVEAVTSNLYFNHYKIDSKDGYDRIDKVGNLKSGYYYYYKKVKNQYEVYRANIQEPNKLTYLFTTSKIDEIKYMRDYVYYKEGNFIKYYHDAFGIRTIALDKEFEFNKSLQYYIYYSTR